MENSLIEAENNSTRAAQCPKNTVNSLTKATNGSLFLYANKGKTYGLLSTHMKMTEPVDRDILEEAVSIAMKRYPYFCVRPVVIEDTYFLEPNDLPFVVTDDGEFTPLGEPASNYHLLTFTCKDDELIINMDHALTDGRGQNDMYYSVLYYYCKLKYNRDFDCPGVKLADSPVGENEYASAYDIDFSAQHLEEITSAADHAPWFKLPEPAIGKNEEFCFNAILVKQSDFLEKARLGDSSPAALATLLLLQAVDEVHPERKENLVCQVPVDYRGAVGLEESNQSCYTLIQIQYHDKMKTMPKDLQNVCTRGQIFVQSDRDQIAKKVAAEKQLFENVSKRDSMEAKRQVYRDLGFFQKNIFSSYVGEVHYGELEQYIESVHFLNDGMGGILLEMTSVGDDFGLDLSFGIEGTEYLKAFLHRLEEWEIPYRVDKEFRFRLPAKTY